MRIVLLSQRVLCQPSCGLRVIHSGTVSYSPAMQILQHCCISKIFRSLPCGTRYKIILIFQNEGLLQFGVQHDVSHRYVGAHSVGYPRKIARVSSTNGLRMACIAVFAGLRIAGRNTVLRPICEPAVGGFGSTSLAYTLCYFVVAVQLYPSLLIYKFSVDTSDI